MRSLSKIKAWVCLIKAPELKNRHIRQLIEVLGEPELFLNKDFDTFSNIDFLDFNNSKILFSLLLKSCSCKYTKMVRWYDESCS